MFCPRCKADQLAIEQAPDSYAKRVYCHACQFTDWLKNYRARQKQLTK